MLNLVEKKLHCCIPCTIILYFMYINNVVIKSPIKSHYFKYWENKVKKEL